MINLEHVKEFSWIFTDVRVRQDTDLGHLTKRIEERVCLDIPAGLTNEEMKNLMVDNLIKYLMTTPEGQADMAKLSDYGLRLADQFAQAMDMLKGRVAGEVASLSEKVITLSDEKMKVRTGYIETDGVLTPTAPTFITLSIGNLEETISTRLKEHMTKYDIQVDTFNLVTCKYFIDKLPRSVDPGLGEASSAIHERLQSAQFSDEDEKKNFMQLLKAVLTESGFDQLFSYLFAHGIYSGKLNEASILASISFCKWYPKFAEVMKSVITGMSDSSEEIFRKNIENLNDIFTVCLCILELARQKYDSKLVIGPTLLNGDEFEKFTQAGGTAEDIANHLRLHYNQNEADIFYSSTAHQSFPLGGIKTQEILVAIPENNTKLEKLKSEIQTRMLSFKQSSTRSAMEQVLKAYVVEIKDHDELVPEGEDKDRFIQKAIAMANLTCENLTRNSQLSIEDALYTFYLNLFLKDTLVSTIYYKMGAELVSQLTHTAEADEEFLNRIHISVMSDILTSYICKAFLMKTK